MTQNVVKVFRLSPKYPTSAKLNLTIIVVLIIALVVTGGGFALYRRSTKAELALLQQQNATYQIAVDQQSNTIATLQADATRQAATAKLLHNQFIASEGAFVADLERIENLDLGEADGIEQRINDEFARSVDGLRKASASK